MPPPPRAPASHFLLHLLTFPLGFFSYVAADASAPRPASQDLGHPVLVRMRQLLLAHAGARAAVDAQDAFGRTALFVAVRLWVGLGGGGAFVGMTACWQGLCTHTRLTNDTMTLTHHQADMLNAEAVRILLEVGGADPTLGNARGVAPLDLLTGRGRAHLRILPTYWPVLRLLKVRACVLLPCDASPAHGLVAHSTHPHGIVSYCTAPERARRARSALPPPQGPRRGGRGLRGGARGVHGHEEGEERTDRQEL